MRQLFLCLLAIPLTACSGPPPGTLLQTPVARVGTNSITAGELLGELKRHPQLRGRDLERLRPDQMFGYASQVLVEMVDRRVCEARSDETVRQRTRQRVEDQIARERARTASDREFERRLADANLTLESLRAGLVHGFLVEELAARDGYPPPEVSEAELRAAHAREPERWGKPAEADVRLMQFELPPDDLSPRRRAARRADAEVARAKAAEWKSGQAWRHLTVRSGRTQPQLERVALRTQVGQLSPVFELGQGYAFLEVIAHRPGTAVAFSDARKRIETVLRREKAERHFARLRERWRDEAGGRILLAHDSLSQPHGPRASAAQAILAGIGLAGLTMAAGYWFHRQRFGWPAMTALILGALVRFGFWIALPYDALANDVEEHLDYIGYVSEHWRVPPMSLGFQFYQPPLYYFLNAAVANPFAPRMCQTVSLFVSMATLTVALWILARAFASTGARWPQTVAMLAIAVHPPLAMFAARVNNDVLAAFWMFLSLGLLARWWSSGGLRFWLGATVCFALAVLTKSTALLLAPALGLCLLLRQAETWQNRVRLGALGCVVVGSLAGWFFVTRFASEGQRDLAANLESVAPALKMDADAAHLVVFNPARVLERPFINGWIATRDRDAFWEYFLRSALFGEFSYRAAWFLPARGLLLATMMTLVLVGIGFVRSQRPGWRAAFPFTCTLVAVLVGHLLYRQAAPFCTSQDFRYSVVVLLPVAYFFVRAAEAWPPLGQRMQVAVGAAFVGLALWFDALIMFS
jgi:hypothetical protein